MQLNHGTPSHEAIDLAVGSLRGDVPVLWRYDGLPPEVFEVVSALAKLAAILAGVVGEQCVEAGGWTGAEDVLEALRAQQLSPGERFAP
ncbi:hypothetical protein [Jatrophihabitans endophyticus]|nr:hypothetical protein [Jatrophihabitans endophyticus]